MKNILELKVKNEDYLLQYLLKNITNKSKNNIKTFLTKGNVLVNNQVITKHDYLLKKGRGSKIGSSTKKHTENNIIITDGCFFNNHLHSTKN